MGSLRGRRRGRDVVPLAGGTPSSRASTTRRLHGGHTRRPHGGCTAAARRPHGGRTAVACRSRRGRVAVALRQHGGSMKIAWQLWRLRGSCAAVARRSPHRRIVVAIGVAPVGTGPRGVPPQGGGRVPEPDVDEEGDTHAAPRRFAGGLGHAGGLGGRHTVEVTAVECKVLPRRRP